ncbi:hypothetical protein K6Q96_06820 [Grimontia kaedaensis]|uniref:Uncharacterized protein n=1 Tax=Grimontia kaedaensis TaxID=2872157 RepID=A0ABY4WXI8_9GAMM|nr:hypothetical protein [Grimontia kaedaensis]USH03699.1 hypothetical protein K6Q96_06820 [Grimontia kaedaensis]
MVLSVDKLMKALYVKTRNLNASSLKTYVYEAPVIATLYFNYWRFFMKKIICTFLLFCVVHPAFAIGTVHGKVVAVRVDGTGQGMVEFDKPIAGTPPSCVHHAFKNKLAFDANTAGGQAVLSLALSAKAMGVEVEAYGLGKCGVYGGTYVETWNYGVMR